MRITFLSPVGVIGGAERVLLAMIRALARSSPRDELTLITFADGPLRAEAERFGANVTVVPIPAELSKLGDTRLRSQRGLGAIASVPIRSVPSASAFVMRLRRAIRESAPDVVHSNGLKAHALTWLTCPPGIPVVWHLHDFLSHRPLMARLLRRMTRGVARCVAISEAVRDDAAGVLRNVPITVIRNSVDTDHFAPEKADGTQLDRLAALEQAGSETIRIGLVATYANWKGQDVFLNALARLPQGTPAIRGYVIGGPIYATPGSQFDRDELEQLASTNRLNGRVGFVPFQNDPVNIYRMLDIVVHASKRAEPFGLTIAEAMSCGRPVVIAAAGGASELFTPGHDGLSHVPGDSEGLAAAITQLVSDADLRARLGSNARQTAIGRFSPERFASEITALVASCAERKPSATRRSWSALHAGR